MARFRRGASLEGGAKLSVAFSRGLANGLIVFPSERTNGSSDHKSSGPFAAPTTLLKVDRAISVECVIESKSSSERMRAHQPFLHRLLVSPGAVNHLRVPPPPCDGGQAADRKFISVFVRKAYRKRLNFAVEVIRFSIAFRIKPGQIHTSRDAYLATLQQKLEGCPERRHASEVPGRV